jgi:hypothetical protein
MLPKTGALALVFLAGAQLCQPAFGQAPPTILVVELENMTRYVYDVADPFKFATDPGVTNQTLPTNFYSQVLISDIVAVNGHAVKGVQILRETILRLNPNGLPGQAISDLGIGAAAADLRWEILNPDGTQIGLLVGQGFSGNTAPAPGAPLAATASTIAIVGGNGAFLGARGVSGQGASSAPIRGASITEDPSNRRNRPGGKGQSVIYLIPMERPEVVVTSGGPGGVPFRSHSRHRSQTCKDGGDACQHGNRVRSYAPGCRARSAVSRGPARCGQFTGGGDGERSSRGSRQRGWMAGAGEHVSRRFPRSSGRYIRSNRCSIERGVDQRVGSAGPCPVRIMMKAAICVLA